MLKYKLTTQDMKTNDDCAWVPGETKRIHTPGNTLCSDQVFHGYHSPEQAVLFNAGHADINCPRLWEVEIDAVCADDSLKLGCKEMTLLREIPLPVFTHEEKVAFAIYCAEPFCRNPVWIKWATDWMSGANRTAEAATWAAAKSLASWAASLAAETAAWAEWAAWGAARAAWGAARVARVARANTVDFQSIIERVRAGRIEP